MNKFTERIDFLLTNFTYDQLNIKDKKLVEAHMSEAEYINYKKLISTAEILGNQKVPSLPKSIQSNLKKEFNKKHNSRKTSQYKTIITAISWLLIGSVLGILASQYFTSKDSLISHREKIITKVDTVIIHKVDTIIRTIKSEPKIIIQKVIEQADNKLVKPIPPLPSNNNSANKSPLYASTERLKQKDFFTNVENEELTTFKIGRSIAEESELMDLLETMPSDGLE